MGVLDYDGYVFVLYCGIIVLFDWIEYRREFFYCFGSYYFRIKFYWLLYLLGRVNFVEDGDGFVMDCLCW